MNASAVMERIEAILKGQGAASARVHLKSHLGKFAAEVNEVLGEDILPSTQVIVSCSTGHQALVMQIMAMAQCQLETKAIAGEGVWLSYDYCTSED